MWCKVLILSTINYGMIMYIPRKLSDVVAQRMFKGKAIILIGARQVGKSTLFRQIVGSNEERTAVTLNCDEPALQELLRNPSKQELASIVGPYDIIFIDEAQRVDGIGMTLKRIVEEWPGKQLLVSGSSAFELHNRLNEPLTGRKYEYYLYPISTGEIAAMPGGVIAERQMLDQRLVYGSYPEILTNPGEVKELLATLADSYLYKDILQLDGIRKSALLDKLLKAVALQLGSEVSFNELAQLVGADAKTVEKYINLLEKCFVIFQLPALSRNLRNELKKSKKIMFWDNGVRNAIIQNFAPLELRADCGALWENFFITERIKYNNNRLAYCNYYFWRTHDSQEIDLIEEADGIFNIFEMKYNPRVKASFPASFLSAYPVGIKAVVTPENYREYLLG